MVFCPNNFTRFYGKNIHSYSRPEAILSRDLAAYLTSKGHIVWWDAGLLAGDMFEEVITREVDAAEVVVVIWTQSSVKSMWVKWEARRAAEAGKLVSVRSEDVPVSDVPPPFDGYNCEMASNFERIAVAIETRLAPAPSVAADAETSSVKITDKRLARRFDRIWQSAIHPDWSVFLAGGWDEDNKEVLQIRSISDGTAQSSFNKSEHGWSSISFSIRGDYFFTEGSLDQASEVWEYKTLKKLFSVRVGDYIQRHFWSWSPDGEVLLVEEIKNLTVWNVPKRRKINTFKRELGSPFSALGPTKDWGGSFKISADKRSFQIWTHEEGLVIKEIVIERADRHQAHVRALAANPDRKLMVTGDALGVVKVWNLQGQPKELLAHTSSVRNISLSKNGIFAVTYSEDGELRIWDLRELKCVEVFQNVGEKAKNISLSPDNEYIAVQAKGKLDIYKLDTRMRF